MLVKPAGDGDDVLGQQRLLLQEPVVVEAVLPFSAMMPSKCTGIMSSTTVMCDGARPASNAFTPRSCSSCSTSMEDCDHIVTKLVSVPSMSKNAALMSLARWPSRASGARLS